ncbi:Gfo/Idh/MocA family oxidoreductase [Paenarthrobacter sp. TYUT067]|uniref:Gfo/Idh/MocA family oxidoreductase n=1 Tax=Paenarthrobacter sp. TYUT067 TaxID=2926245 RepID=UPI00203074B7|nr:Gfo/Idh/MocA family oxidoreductase [Paenarthrobacter sp. TYUT067]MCM0616835.1 Gfo/Idh/MocA family oxidoreductase [Paenarthrobacter sp. TYUT067]
MKSLTRNRLRVAVIGYGLSGRRIHVPLLRSVPETDVTAIVVRSEAGRAAAARENPGTGVFPDIESMVAAGVLPDIAIVATPDSTHAALSAELLDAGIGVVVDKPLATTSLQAEHLNRQATESGLVYTCFQNRRWDSDFLTVAKLVTEGSLGEVTRFENAIAKWIPTVGSTWRDAAADAELDGGLAGLGSHLVDQALCLFGPVESVYAEVDTRRPGAQANDDTFVAMTHVSGVRTHLCMSAHTSTPVPRFRVQGTKGSFVKSGFDVQQEALVSLLPPSGDDWGLEDDAHRGILTVQGIQSRISTERGDWKIFYRRLAQALLEGTALPIVPEEVIHGLRILEAAVESHSRKTTVFIDQMGAGQNSAETLAVRSEHLATR